MSKPTYIYKLIPHSFQSSISLTADSIPVSLPVSDLDQSSGFIHLSTSLQLPNTLLHFFKDYTKVYVLRLPCDPLQEQKLIKWEDPKAEVCGERGGEGMFPHLYNGLKLGKEEVDYVGVLERDDSEESWDRTIGKAKEDWLVY